MTEQQMTPHQALSFLCSAIRCGEVFDGHHSQAAEIIRAALSHAERREFKTEQDLISFLDGLYETAGPDSSALTGQKWVAAQRAIEGIRSHAEGEAVEPIGYLTLQAVARLQGDDRLNGEHLYAFDPDDMSKFRGVYLHPAPQVAVPEALTKYDGYVPPEDGSAGEYYVDGWNSCRDALLANSAPAQTVSASVPEQKTWNQVGGREDLRYTEGWNDCRAAMLAAAPAAPAGELVTRCTAGLGCDEKGYCDAAATGQGDLCDRRTMAHEQPVSDPDGLPEPGRREAEQAYINGAFDYARDPIGSRDWVLFWNGWQARNKASPAPDEREIAARAIEQITREYFNDESGPHNLHDYLLWRAKRLSAGKEGE